LQISVPETGTDQGTEVSPSLGREEKRFYEQCSTMTVSPLGEWRRDSMNSAQQ